MAEQVQEHLDKVSSHLNEQQLEMLRLFKNPMENSDYVEIKRLIVKILARKIDDEMSILEKRNDWTPDTYEQWGKEHLRTPYKR